MIHKCFRWGIFTMNNFLLYGNLLLINLSILYQSYKHSPIYSLAHCLSHWLLEIKINFLEK